MSSKHSTTRCTKCGYMTATCTDCYQAQYHGNSDVVLQFLRDLIGAGWEYPDAHTKTVLHFQCNGDALTTAYDAVGDAA